MSAGKLTKISACGRVTSVAPTFAFVSSKKHGSVFVNSATEMDVEDLPPMADGQPPDLTRLLQVDEVVHFKAIKNFGPKDCPWLAIWLRPSRRQEAATSAAAFPQHITDEHGVVVNVQERSMFIWSNKYGEIYCPLGVHLTNIRENVDAAMDGVQLHATSMRDFFKANEAVVFSATRQTEENNCLYVATSVKTLAELLSNAETEDTRGDIGKIVKLTPHYGFILSDSLGMLFFSLSNCIVSSPTQMLTDLFQLTDMVKFNPMRQPEVNGCCWRALNVTKLEVPASDETFWRHAAEQPTTASHVPEPVEQPMLPYAPLDTEDKACQTHPSPEALLLRAVLSNPSFCDELRTKFPHLMRMIDKSL